MGLLLVVVVVYMAIGFGCDKMSLNSLYWDVDAPIAHPFCDHFSIGRKICDRTNFDIAVVNPVVICF